MAINLRLLALACLIVAALPAADEIASNDQPAAAPAPASAPSAPAEPGDARPTRFTDPVVVSSGSAALPDRAAIDAAITELKTRYKDSYAKHKAADKAAFAKTLADAAGSHPDATGYAMDEEAARLAVESEDWLQVLAISAQITSSYANTDYVSIAKKALERGKSKPPAGAIYTLLSDAHDRNANNVAGRYWAFALGDWDTGLPMLALGSDNDLRDLATRELNGANDSDAQLRLADGWFAVGRKTSAKTDKLGEWTRAQKWYEQVQPGLADLDKDRVAKNLALITQTFPPKISDWDHLTPEQWDSLPGPIYVVPGRQDRTDPGITMTPGKRLRIVPHPTDQWSVIMGKRDRYKCDYHGLESHPPLLDMPKLGSLAFQIGSTPPQSAGIAEGSGVLWLMPFGPYGSVQGIGNMRVKIIPVGAEN